MNNPATKKDTPYIWVTWLTPFLSGESHCQWSAWFQSNYKFSKLESNFDFEDWNLKHSRLVNQRAESLDGQGFDVYVEDANSFVITGKDGVTKVAGKPDIVAIKDNQAIVEDCKTGKRKTSDIMQVLTYMLLLKAPGSPEHCKNINFDGRLVYNDVVMDIDQSLFDEEFKADFKKIVTTVSSTVPAKKSPSLRECKYCKISTEYCPERVKEKPPEDFGGHDLF